MMKLYVVQQAEKHIPTHMHKGILILHVKLPPTDRSQSVFPLKLINQVDRAAVQWSTLIKYANVSNADSTNFIADLVACC